ncbi:MAG: GGDEF domain-containing protein [Aquabacterium sp.]|nr:GGDEF domain-containing protein [Aquabacterium sp.]
MVLNTPIKSDQREASDSRAPLGLFYQKQSVLDVAQRMRNGLLLYPIIWPILMQVDNYTERHPWFVGINGLCLVAASILRLFFHRRLKRALDRQFNQTRFVFRVLSLGYSLYWGILCALIMTATDTDSLKWMMLMTTVGITAGGTVIVALDPVLPLLYPLFTLGPTVFGLLPQGGTVNLAISTLSAVFFAYSVSIARLVGRDYWARQRSQALLEQRARELEAISRTDALTQVPNRLLFQERLSRAWRDAQRSGQPLSIAMVDLDFFKRINDNHGHPFGDLCLQAAARALTQAIHKPSDLIARYGGEEFVILMPNTDLQGAQAVAQRLLAGIGETVVKQGAHMVTLSCSIGVSSMAPTMRERAEQLMEEADVALYQAKQTGRAKVACYEAASSVEGKRNSSTV